VTEINFLAENSVFAWPLLLAASVYSLLQIIFEIKQMKGNLKEYFLSEGFIWNFLDLSSSILVISFTVITLMQIDIGRIMLFIGGFASFLTWIKLFYYLRIFKPTSSFIHMIVEMLKDIRVFLLIYFIGIFAFSSFYYVLDKGHTEKVTGFENGSYTDSVIYTYMQSLGELGYDNFEGA